MNSLKILSIFVLSAALIAGTSCKSNTQKEENTNTSDSLKIVKVKSMKTDKETITRTIEYTTNLLPFEEIHLAPSTPGRIEKINVEVSDWVKAGQVLVQMDLTQLYQAKINMLSLETDFKRLDTLNQTGSIAPQQYDQIKARYELAKSNYEFMLKNTQLKAPFNGIISGKYFENGEVYTGSPVMSIGKPAIVSVIQINSLKAQVNLSASYFPYVKTGLKTEIFSELYPGKLFKGTLTRIYPTIDNATKTFTVEIRIQNDGLVLRPGMFAKIRINLGQGSAILIPSISVIKQTGTNSMYVFVNENNVAVKKFVKTGIIMDDKTEIIEGLNVGEELIIVGQNKLEDKSKIEIIKD
jgi:membrane fusion protein (multidrug efflux system)